MTLVYVCGGEEVPAHCVCVCVCVCARARVCVQMRVHAHTSVPFQLGNQFTDFHDILCELYAI
jgi:hypothetical protein